MAADDIIAPHRIVDDDLGRVVYGVGDLVPHEDAVKYGLVGAAKKAKPPSEAPAATPAKKAAPAKARAKKGPVEDRMKPRGENRGA